MECGREGRKGNYLVVLKNRVVRLSFFPFFLLFFFGLLDMEEHTHERRDADKRVDITFFLLKK